MATPLPSRDLQSRAIEPSREKPETTTCEEGDEECVEEPIPVDEVFLQERPEMTQSRCHLV